MLTPVTLVTGFPGSGKMTLIARLLRQPGLANTAVIVNGFGEVGLDHALLERLDGDVVLLPRGCVWCMLNGTIADTRTNWSGTLVVGRDRDRFVLIGKGVVVQRFDHAREVYPG